MPKNLASMIRNKFPMFVNSLKSLSSDVLVGVPSTGTQRREKGAAMNNATLAYIHDNGSPAANIPARPFMRPGIKTVQSRIVETLKAGASGVLRADPGQVDKALNRAGLIAQSSIRAEINSGIAPPLAASTLAARRARGRTGTKPLVDTAQLRNSINYVVRTK